MVKKGGLVMAVTLRVKRSSRSAGHAMALLEKAGIALDGPGDGDLQVYDERFYGRVLRDRELGLGESYQAGWWGARRVDKFIAKILEVDLANEIRSSPRLLAFAALAKVWNRQTLRRAATNASAHYDIGNDLYERMLDRRMVYSCGYWADADNLDDAQEAKLQLICDKLKLEPGMHLLDIGCGWGGLAQYAAERYGVRVTGVSLAAQQVKVATQRCQGLEVDIKQLDFRHVKGRFDRVVSVGMLEHVGPKNYQAFFDASYELLASDGIALHHTIGSSTTKNHTDPWFDKYIFPAGVIPSLEQLGAATQGKWVVEDIHNFGPDYDKTLLAWHNNINQVWDEIPRYDEHFRRTWQYYLLSSAASFRVRALHLWQIVMRPARRVAPVYQAVR